MLPVAQGSSVRVPGVLVVHGPVVMAEGEEAAARRKVGSLVVHMCRFLEDEVGSYPTVTSYLEKQYPTQAAKLMLHTELKRLYMEVGRQLSAQSSDEHTCELLCKDPCLEVAPDTRGSCTRTVERLGHKLPLWSLPFETSGYFSGGEPTVNVLRDLETKLGGCKRQELVVVSYNLPGLQCGVQLPPFGVTVVVGAAQVLYSFLVAHALLCLQQWRGIPDTLDLPKVILALEPRYLLELFRIRVQVPVQEEAWGHTQWSCLYLDTALPRPNPVQVLAAITGVAQRCRGDLMIAVQQVMSYGGWSDKPQCPKRVCKIEPSMWDTMQLIGQFGEAVHLKLQVG